jgi:hypothetical protein
METSPALRAKRNNGDEYADARRFGWRHDPYDVIDRVLAVRHAAGT